MITFVPEPQLPDSARGRDWPHLPDFGAGPVAAPPGTADVVIVGAGPAGLAVAFWRATVREIVPAGDGVTMRAGAHEVTARFVVL